MAQLFTIQPGNRKIVGTVGELQFEVIQYRLEHEYGAKCRFADCVGRSGKGEHRAVMVGVCGVMQEPDAGNGRHCGEERLHDSGIPAFTKIRHTFDQVRHGCHPNETTKPEEIVIPSGFTSIQPTRIGLAVPTWSS